MLGDADAIFPFLEELDLWNTYLSSGDLHILAEAVKCGKLPQLKILNLSKNFLRDRIQHLLGDAEVMFPFLEHLHLNNTALSEGDLQILSQALQGGQLQELCSLSVSVLTHSDALKALQETCQHRDVNCCETWYKPYAFCMK